MYCKRLLTKGQRNTVMCEKLWWHFVNHQVVSSLHGSTYSNSRKVHLTSNKLVDSASNKGMHCQYSSSGLITHLDRFGWTHA
ncbi:hypothetical protein PR048_013266 [Dryococelus australis]|uniref:Uncharacterized protein n=1 Tax=Dryococelus australis TaxID=614101 RepID=A0ABQ9HRU8_9NEOP|nr:hypothetical protein PR048_013266 [Dryococelus australis]